MTIVGFTGTRKGMTEEQKKTVKKILASYQTFGAYFHHGDCVGADAEAHDIAKELRYPIVIHPPIKEDYRAHCQGALLVLSPRRYLDRNRDIVEASDVVVATPEGVVEKKSGTWYTIRYAERTKRQLTIVWPDGSVKEL